MAQNAGTTFADLVMLPRGVRSSVTTSPSPATCTWRTQCAGTAIGDHSSVGGRGSSLRKEKTWGVTNDDLGNQSGLEGIGSGLGEYIGDQ
jgi:hypothetical protein